jgi:uncharacterized protein (TIGR02246 family)
MARSKAPPPPATDSPDEVEAQFYAALQQADLTRLMALWADEDEVVCVHPGGGRVVGPAAIRASFEAIFANGAIPVQPEQVHRLHGPGWALHHLAERVTVQTDEGERSAWVSATNVYVKGPAGWRIVAHHASPGAAAAPEVLGSGGPATLH